MKSVQGQEKVDLIKSIIIAVSKDEDITNDDKIFAFDFLITQLGVAEWEKENEK